MSNRHLVFLALILSTLGSASTLYGQKRSLQKDSTRASDILRRSHIADARETPPIHPLGLQLDLSKRKARKIMKMALYPTYGRWQIWKEKPFNIYKQGSYWIAWGSMRPNRPGGVFEIVVNAGNARVEFLSHGK